MSTYTLDECISKLHQDYEIICQIDCNYSDIGTAKVDLYAKLKQAHRESYQPTQRLIFVLEQDLYNNNSISGSILQAIQIILQDIDISNFFVCLVTTNPEIDLEYNYIKNNVSLDPVNFHVYQCAGHFEKIYTEHIAVQGKIQSLKDINLESLNDKQQNLLFTDPVFCIMPWVGINVRTDSNVYPCGNSQHHLPVGNVKNQRIDEIWNSEKMNSMRKSMLNRTPVDSCSKCYTKEKLKHNSSRLIFNKEFAKYIDIVDSTNFDGSLPTTEIKYWDVRYSNLCNFSCRSCDSRQSTSWHQVHNAIYPDKKIQIPILEAGNDHNPVFDQICKNVNHIDTIYFAGGEPAMIENFYKILELLIEQNRTDVNLRYNINMSRLTLKDKSLLELWKHFKHVSVGASLDASGPRASYLRVGTDWDVIVQHRKEIAEKCPHVDFWVSATTGLINALHVPDFHRSWVEQEFIKPEDFHIQLLLFPAYQSVLNAPYKLKQKIITRYTQHLEWLRPLDKTGRAIHGFNTIIEMCHSEGTYDSTVFWSEINKLDQYHNTDLLETFPELKDSGL